MGLGATETVGFLGAVRVDAGPVREDHLTRRTVRLGHNGLGDAREKPRLAFDADVPCFAVGRGNYRDAMARMGAAVFRDVLGTAAGLAESTAREEQPDQPVTGWCQLVRALRPLFALRVNVRMMNGLDEPAIAGLLPATKPAPLLRCRHAPQGTGRAVPRSLRRAESRPRPSPRSPCASSARRCPGAGVPGATRRHASHTRRLPPRLCR